MKEESEREREKREEREEKEEDYKDKVKHDKAYDVESFNSFLRNTKEEKRLLLLLFNLVKSLDAIFLKM